jgi:predicted Rossmann fold nucleotide-binding protein DprA/Smf involved in DNA uptake
MKIAIIGSRDFTNYERMVKILSVFGFDKAGNEIVSGGAIGADALGKAFAEDANLKYTEFSPDWSNGKSAGMIRNKKIVEYSDFVIAFWNGDSSGTRNSIEIARQMKKPTFIVYF